MLLRNTMILVLVVWLLVGWVRSHQDATASSNRERRAHLKRRMLERLARRGMEIRERERVAEELLARLDAYSTTTSTSPSRHQRDHHRSLQRHNSRALPEAPYPEFPSYAQVFPQLGSVQEVRDTQEEEEQQEAEEVEVEMESRDVLRQFLLTEIIHNKMLERRHVDAATEPDTEPEVETEMVPEMVPEILPEIEPEQTTRRSREERRREKEEKRRRREEKKKKRANKKNKQKKRNRELEAFAKKQNITVHEVDGERFLDCCPSKLVVVEQLVSRVPGNSAPWEIREDHRYFYERVCLDEYLGKECIFPARSLRKGVVTRCAQEYSYSQAIIRPFNNATAEFQMGHILVRSGCSCQVSLTHRRKKRKR